MAAPVHIFRSLHCKKGVGPFFNGKTNKCMTLSGMGRWVSSVIFQKPVSGLVLRQFSAWTSPGYTFSCPHTFTSNTWSEGILTRISDPYYRPPKFRISIQRIPSRNQEQTSGCHFCLTFPYEWGLTMEKQTKKTSVWG